MTHRHRPRHQHRISKYQVEPPRARPQLVSEPQPPRLDSLPATLDRAALERVLSVVCDRHDAEPGEPCYDFPVGCCGARIERASGYDVFVGTSKPGRALPRTGRSIAS